MVANGAKGCTYELVNNNGTPIKTAIGTNLKWGFDFMLPFKLATTRTGNNYVIIGTKCYTT